MTQTRRDGEHGASRGAAALPVPTGEAGNSASARDQFAALIPISERISGLDHHRAVAARASLEYWTSKATDECDLPDYGSMD